MSERARHESMVRLAVRRSTTPRGRLAIAACWCLLVFGVVLIPTICTVWAVITAGPIEYSGPRPPWSNSALALMWTARITATASALCVLAITVAVTARGGRLVNGWVVLVLSSPFVLLLWDLQPV